ncbi:MAG: helix-turn-helix transcriptional regulator [Lachnospiraceae bacterium]|nr:helix-turn-helix transcriptional regulator [Lachnospiraceae bacterium]
MKLDRKKFDIARARACVTQDELEKAGVHKCTLSRAINGKDIKPITLGKIARALNIDVTEIIED